MRSALPARCLLGLALAASPACSAGPPADEPAASSSASIAGGALDVEHSAVFQLFTRWDEGIGACTATLIAPNLLLTARHCISPGQHTNIVCGMAALGDAVPAGSVFVTNDPMPGANSLFYRAADLRVQPESDDTCGWDVALVILEENVPEAQAVPTIPRVDRPAERGEPYVAIGYGVNADGEQNEGRMLLDGLEVRCSTDCNVRYQVEENEFLGDTGVCSGDSGGPALDAQGKVIGVVSRGSDPCATPIYGSVAAFGGWIIETAFEAAASGGYPAPFWAWSGVSDLAPGLRGSGEPCQSGGECLPGHLCYFESDPADASCVAICENDDQCAEDRFCAPGFEVRGGGICLAPPEDVDPPDAGAAGATSEAPPRENGRGADDGCAVRSPGKENGYGLAWLVAYSLLVGFRARRRD
ncbi:MAG TPA: trypsin-like serine protease, partial [Polyangiaceae bacterium]